MSPKIFQKKAHGVLTQVIGPKRFRQSLLFFFGTSCAASLVSLILYVFIFRKTALQSSQWSYYLLYFLIPTLFTIGILLLQTRWSLKWAKPLDFLIVLTVLGILTMIAVKTGGSKALALFYGILILWHAATVPVTVNAQLGFAITTLIFFLFWRIFFTETSQSSFLEWFPLRRFPIIFTARHFGGDYTQFVSFTKASFRSTISG